MPSPSRSGPGPSFAALLAARRHLELCADCSRKVSEYRQLVNRLSDSPVAESAAPRPDCPKDVDWHEVAAGLWPELKARQLIMHAALCDHCGPRLRAATSVSDEPTPDEEEMLAQLKPPSRPMAKAEPLRVSPTSKPVVWRQYLQWKILAPALALIVIVGVLGARLLSSKTPFSGSQFAEFAVDAHQQHAQGYLALDVQSDSQQAVNEWLKAKPQFALALPASAAPPREQLPYRLEGARLVPARGKTAALIAYQMQTGPVSLMVTPDSVAAASGGVQAAFKKVSFHYRMVNGYKVVTWSVHGLTYALVSQEGNRTQQSCMVCHSAMGDRDLSHTPTPLDTEQNPVHPMLQ